MKGVDQCPACGSERSIHLMDFKERLKGLGFDGHAACLDCSAVWEPFRESDLTLPGDDLSIFKKPCDNCAFRPNSPERNDPAKWELLMQDIHYRGSMFFCHKGVPCDMTDSDQSHIHPTKADGTYDVERLRPCAGWLAQRLGRIARASQRIKDHERARITGRTELDTDLRTVP